MVKVIFRWVHKHPRDYKWRLSIRGYSDGTADVSTEDYGFRRRVVRGGGREAVLVGDWAPGLDWWYTTLDVAEVYAPGHPELLRLVRGALEKAGINNPAIIKFVQQVLS